MRARKESKVRIANHVWEASPAGVTFAPGMRPINGARGSFRTRDHARVAVVRDKRLNNTLWFIPTVNSLTPKICSNTLSPGGKTLMIKGNVILAVCLGLSLASSLFGQAQSGTIVGVVRDQGGAVVPGATVTIVNEGTNFTRSLVTNPSGEYTAYSFPTGRLSVSVAQPGFQKLVRSGVVLTAADTLTVDLTLTLGNVQETVQVTAEASLLQSQTATVSSPRGFDLRRSVGKMRDLAACALCNPVALFLLLPGGLGHRALVLGSHKLPLPAIHREQIRDHLPGYG